MRSSRRSILSGLIGVLLAAASAAAAVTLPTDNPAARHKLKWTDGLPWGIVANVNAFAGDGWTAKFEAACAWLTARGGGVVFFPAGTYQFRDHIRLPDGIILRGEAPDPKQWDPRYGKVKLATKFEFPKYEPKLTGAGAPIATAFKGIYLKDPATASNVGVVHIEINRGHVHFAGRMGEDGKTPQMGRNRVVIGCILRNAAVADPAIPDRKRGQHAWQRFTKRHHAAVAVYAAENILVADNRLLESGDDNFEMAGYVVAGEGGAAETLETPVVFDYDNRPGIYANDFALGSPRSGPPDGTPQTHPWGFAKGITIVGNYVFCTGRCAISFSGDGTLCASNEIRFKRDCRRPTADGLAKTTAGSSNDNRAIQARGYRWEVSRNRYEVHPNLAADGESPLADGEGILHADPCNCLVVDSKILYNNGNAPIVLYKTGGIDGLEVLSNDVRTTGKINEIFVVADRDGRRCPIRNVVIQRNKTYTGGITVSGSPAEGCVIQTNEHRGRTPGQLVNKAKAEVKDNKNYTVAAE